MTSRYSAKRITETTVHVLDSKHGNLPAAMVFRRTTVDGTGWKLMSMSSTRGNSRRLHASPEDAIASMKYMSRSEAQVALMQPHEGATK